MLVVEVISPKGPTANQAEKVRLDALKSGVDAAKKRLDTEKQRQRVQKAQKALQKALRPPAASKSTPPKPSI